MTPFLSYTLIVHVIAGTAAIGLLHLVFMHFLRKTPPWGFLRLLAGGSAALFFVSWAASAYYYVAYYGTEVKSRILDGPFPWAHQIFMESKEHIFIMVPFLALTIWLLTKYLGETNDDSIKNAGKLIALAATSLGLFVAIAGILVSGAVR